MCLQIATQDNKVRSDQASTRPQRICTYASRPTLASLIRSRKILSLDTSKHEPQKKPTDLYNQVKVKACGSSNPTHKPMTFCLFACFYPNTEYGGPHHQQQVSKIRVQRPPGFWNSSTFMGFYHPHCPYPYLRQSGGGRHRYNTHKHHRGIRTRWGFGL